MLSQATKRLQDAGVETARIDAVAIIEHFSGHSKARIVSGDIELNESQQKLIKQALAKRQNHEPLAYILGFKEFYTRDFIVTADTLIPRPESEDIINLATKIDPSLYTTITDLGCGSGALGITLALEIKINKNIKLIDISEAALEIAKLNLKKHSLAAELTHNDLTAQWQPEDGLLLANLPYVPANMQAGLITNNPELGEEPSFAIFQDSGLGLYKVMFARIRESKKSPVVITECLDSQLKELDNIALNNGYALSDRLGLCSLYVPDNS